jgi:hypothetical protein
VKRLVACAIVAACAPHRSPTVVAPRVDDSSCSQPGSVSGVVVVDGVRRTAMVTLESRSGSRVAATDASGAFTFTDVQPASYHVRVWAGIDVAGGDPVTVACHQAARVETSLVGPAACRRLPNAPNMPIYCPSADLK